MPKRKKIGFGLVALGLLLPSLVFAAGDDIQFSVDTLVNLTGLNINLTVAAGSKVESYSVGTSSATFNLNTGSYLDLRSTDFRRLTNIYIDTTCAQNYSQLIFTTITSAQTVIVTPGATNVCNGGGGGGGGAVYVPANPGTNMAHAAGTLVNDNGTIYLIQNGKRLGFRNPQEYNSYGYNFGQAVAATAADRALPLATGAAKAMEGTLVVDAADNRTVYMIGLNGTKRGFTSEAVFKALGYSFGKLPKVDLSDYAAGPVVDSSSAAHPEGALVLDKNDNRTVWWVKGGTRVGFESAAVYNTYGFSFSRIVKANSADMALPIAAAVKFRDGTLVNDGGTYWLISEGKKRPFASSSALAAKGYKISNVISASLANYQAGAAIE